MCTIVRSFSRYTFPVSLSACFPGEGCWEGRMRLGKGGWRWMPFKGALVCEHAGPRRQPTMGQTLDFNQDVGSSFVPVHESKE